MTFPCPSKPYVYRYVYKRSADAEPKDVDMSMFSGQTLPVYRVPGLARTARMAQEEDSYQSAPAPYNSQVSGADRLASDVFNREYIICRRCLKL